MPQTDADTRPPWLWPRAAYIHVPFCAHQCGYCDFAVAIGQEERIDAYLGALSVEMSSLKTAQPVHTLFLGGGTPTHLDVRQLGELLERVLTWFPLLPGHEFSVEANPRTLDEDKVRILAAHGVNRISLGAQSFAPHLLRVLERDHAPADIDHAVDRVRRHIANVSLDLIFGVPGQQPADWQRDLEMALALEPTHLATYGLTYEKGTRLWKQRARGMVLPLSEETELDFYVRAMDTLEGAGFEHYEISNFARPEYRCRHNQVYWANHAYFGFGQGAARYVEGVRQTTVRDFAGYLHRVHEGRPTWFQSEQLEPRDRALETIALQLRRKEGVGRRAFETQTGFSVEELVGDQVDALVELEMVTVDDGGVRLTRKGKCLADAVIARLL